ncbi:hypothetical protein BFP76_01635 [Amylibacter kogurei]|uniref:Uncharacterized protein n=1 Tax=Paramylibacter kogurei TaxID=1889778 RepID=A0A2G5K4E1_9RHOB|nr:hypothetical protein BFP76_01635 [Amylibacter kogurei]
MTTVGQVSDIRGTCGGRVCPPKCAIFGRQIAAMSQNMPVIFHTQKIDFAVSKNEINDPI